MATVTGFSNFVVFYRMKSKYLLVFLVLSVVLSVYLYKPLPSSIPQPWTVRLFLMSLKVIEDIASVGEVVGFGSKLNNSRAIQESISSLLLGNGESTQNKIEVSDLTFDGVPVRVYQAPVEKGELTGAIVFYHGGGWTFGSINTHHVLTMKLAELLRITLVSVGYRLAPEVRYPTPLDDCLKATVHFFKSVKTYHVNPKRIVIMGDSAGGNLAAAVVLRMRALKPTVGKAVAQVLIYPVLQAFDLRLPSMLTQDDMAYGTVTGLAYHLLTYMGESLDFVPEMVVNNHTTPEMKSRFSSIFDVRLLPEKYRTLEVRTPSEKLGNRELAARLEKYVLDPFFAPLMASDLKGLPDTYVLTCEHDVLRDEGILYGAKLKEAGVTTEMVDYPGGYHGFVMLLDGPLATELAASAIDNIVNFLRPRLAA